jgi:anhydro-N-acetylmuramic acid kinase
MIKNKTFSTLSLGIDPDYVEASCFAWLAKERLNKRSFDLSKITGSNKKVLLGEVWQTV